MLAGEHDEAGLGGPCGWLTCHVIKLFTRPLVHCVERWCSFGGRIENRETHTSHILFFCCKAHRAETPVPSPQTDAYTHVHTCHCVQCCLKVPGTFGTAGTASVYEMRPCADPRLTQITHMRTSLPRSSRPRSATRCDKFSYRIVEFIFPQHQRISQVHSSKSRPRGARHTSPYDRVGHS